jgi:hypothetical protein
VGGGKEVELGGLLVELGLEVREFGSVGGGDVLEMRCLVVELGVEGGDDGRVCGGDVLELSCMDSLKPLWPQMHGRPSLSGA